MSQMLRTFIAVEIGPDVQKSLKTIQEHLKTPGADVKWVNPSIIHLTLKFLGEIPSEKVKKVSEWLPEISVRFGRIRTSINHLGVFPSSGMPRVVWAGMEENAEQLIHLAQSLEEALGKIGFAKEKKSFHPHVTLGRVRSSRCCDQLRKAIQEYAFPSPLTFSVEKIIFFQSTLTPQGSIYTPLTIVPLK